MTFANGASEIDYTTITYGGYGFSISDGPLQVTSGSLSLDHDTIENNERTGVVVTGVSSPYPSVTVTHSTIDDNGSGMYVSAATATVDDNTQISDNSAYGISFDLPTGTSPDESIVDHSSIEDNGSIEIYLGVDSTFSDGLYPSGIYDNIDGNDSGDLGIDLYVPYLNATDDWESNYWDESGTSCLYSPTGVHIGGEHELGPVTAAIYEGPSLPDEPPPWCYGDNVDTGGASGWPLDNS